jgi:type I restriction enzyme M protein
MTLMFLRNCSADALAYMERLTTDQKREIFNRIQSLDPSGEIVTLRPNEGLKGGSISYNKKGGITLYEEVSRLTDEEYVRAFLVVRLIKQLKYPPNCVELEKGYTIGRPTGKSAQLDIRVLDKRDGKTKTFMLIEAKRPDEFESYTQLIEDQLFSTGKQEHANGVRYIVWYSLDSHLGEPRDACIIIDFRKFTEYKEWVEAGELGHNLDLPSEYGIVRKTRYIKGKIDLRNDVTRDELTRLQKDFHNVLWGGAKMGDTDVFNNLLKMFIAKIYDEQTTEEGQAYRFQADLKDGSPETAQEILSKVNKIYQDALYHYFKFDNEAIKRPQLTERSSNLKKLRMSLRNSKRSQLRKIDSTMTFWAPSLRL